MHADSSLLCFCGTGLRTSEPECYGSNVEYDVDGSHALIVFWLLRACKIEVCRFERKALDISGRWLPFGWCVHRHCNFPETSFPLGSSGRTLRVRAISSISHLTLFCWMAGLHPRRLVFRYDRTSFASGVFCLYEFVSTRHSSANSFVS